MHKMVDGAGGDYGSQRSPITQSKLLIHMNFNSCPFGVQCNRSLDLQGFAADRRGFSTKLSTEIGCF